MNIQTLLVIGSLIALTYSILTMNTSQNVQSGFQLNNEATISATGIGQSLLEQIELKAFDEETISNSVADTDSLTSSYSLGKDAGETTHYTFDDFDDYNGYTKTESLTRLGTFSTEIEVYYVNTMSPDTKVFYKTFSKRIDISVANEYLLDTLVFAKVISY